MTEHIMLIVMLVVVDQLTKMAYYVLTRKDEASSEKVARLYFDNILHLQGLPDSIVSNRGTQFTSVFSRTLWTLVGTTRKLSTSFHPQTNG